MRNLSLESSQRLGGGGTEVNKEIYLTVPGWGIRIRNRIRIRIIRMVLGLPDPDPLVTDADPDHSLFS